MKKQNKECLLQLQRVIPRYSIEAPKRAWARKNVNILVDIERKQFSRASYHAVCILHVKT